jgi:hypothetical protein
MTEQQERRRTVFQCKYDSEINFAVSCLRDGGFDVKLGDGLNGFKDELCDWFEAAARVHYPNSHFVKGLP